MCLHRCGVIRGARVSLNCLDQECGLVPTLRIYPALKFLIYRMTLLYWVFQHSSGDWWRKLSLEQEMKWCRQPWEAFPTECCGVKGQCPDWVMQKMCFCFHPFKTVSFPPWVWEPWGDECSGILCHLPPDGAAQCPAPGEDAHFLWRTARKWCFLLLILSRFYSFL